MQNEEVTDSSAISSSTSNTELLSLVDKSQSCLVAHASTTLH